MSGPFKMKGFSYPGKSPAKFSWKKAMKGGGTMSPITGFIAGNKEKEGFNRSTDDGNSLANAGNADETTVNEVNNDVDNSRIQNEVSSMSDDEKNEALVSVAAEKTKEEKNAGQAVI